MLFLQMAGKENKPTKTTTLNVTFLASTGFTGAEVPAGLASLRLTPRHMYCCILASLPYACKPDKQLQAGGQALTACQIGSAQGGSLRCCFTLLPPCDEGKYIYMYRRSHTTFAKTVAAATLLLGEKEGQSFFTLAAKLRVSLAPRREGSRSRGAATAWPQTLFKQIRVSACLLPAPFCLDRRSWGHGTAAACYFFQCAFRKAGSSAGTAEVFHVTLLNNI